MQHSIAIIRGIVIAFILLGCAISGQAQKSARPNIILIMAEDIGNDLACYGTPGVKTPIVDKMAREGIRYNRFYTNSPICSPSRLFIP